MTQTRLDAALKRLASALDQLEAASVRLASAEERRSDRQDELAIMLEDRLRLADELDGVLTKNHVLHVTQADISKRLERASAVILDVLGKAAAQPDHGKGT